MGVEVVANEDGSVTTRLVDEDGVQAPTEAAEPEAKVVKAPAKKAAASQSKAEGK